MKTHAHRWIVVAAIISVGAGAALSHMIEPGVRVQKVTLAEETPALEFLPTSPGPHPVALLAHGFTGSKETLFRYGEALAAAGFICYGVDQPGHGASPRTFTIMDTVHTLEAVAREVGPVDVFVGHSMGGITGGEAVREGGMKLKLFIAVGFIPVLGEHAPPLLLLAGRFEEIFTPALLKTRTDARVVISPWSDHVFEMWDPLLVNTAVQAACAEVHAPPPPPPTAWRWRLLGVVLAILGAGTLAFYLPELFPQLARVRGLLSAVFLVVSVAFTVGHAWLDAAPHLRFFPKQGIAMAVTFLLAMVAGRLRLPRWSFAALGVLAMMIAFCWSQASGSFTAFVFTMYTFVSTPALIAGTAFGWIAARRGSRLQGDIAMAIIVGCACFQWFEFPRKAPVASQPHEVIQLDAKLLDACAGEYEIAPDNVFSADGVKATIQRKGDHLVWQGIGRNALPGALDVYPESETNFLVKINGAQLTFIKNDKGEVTGIIHQMAGLPDSEGKKLKN